MTDLVETNLYYSATDSVIGDKHYHTIFHQINGSVNDPIGKNSSVCGFVREDTVNGKFWFLNSFADTTIEVLLMDLSLDKGDTFVFIHDYRYMWKDSVTVDSVFHENNRKIIALNKTHFDGFGESKIWFIEGIGPNTGFFMAEPYQEPYFYGMLCKFDNNKHVYSAPSVDILGACFYVGGGGVQINKLEDWINIYPNPASSKINIQLKNLSYQNSQLYLYNSTGSLIFSRPLTSENDYLEISRNGIYFLKVVSGNIILNKKIVVVGN